MHSCIGAIIRRDGKYLLLDRKNIPYGFASIAGHIEQGQTAEDALRTEVKEESQLTILSFKKLFEEDVPWSTCWKHKGHNWRVFECETEGKPTPNHEAKSMGWFTAKQIKELKLEPVWEYFFKKLGVI